MLSPLGKTWLVNQVFKTKTTIYRIILFSSAKPYARECANVIPFRLTQHTFSMPEFKNLQHFFKADFYSIVQEIDGDSFHI